MKFLTLNLKFRRGRYFITPQKNAVVYIKYLWLRVLTYEMIKSRGKRFLFTMKRMKNIKIFGF
jgi:hypothetical protein